MKLAKSASLDLAERHPSEVDARGDACDDAEWFQPCLVCEREGDN
jgi:hypothetical protein